MISKEEVRELLKSTETYRIERTTSTGDMDKFQEAICASVLSAQPFLERICSFLPRILRAEMPRLSVYIHIDR